MKSLPSIWFALIVLALLAALTYWIDRTVQPPAPKRDGSTRHDPDYIVNNFTSAKSDEKGNPRYTLSGVEMRHFPDDDSTELVKPAFSQFSLKKPTTTVSGDRGMISSNGENVYFMDNVKVVRAASAQKGELTVLTDYLHIIPDQSLIKTDREVTILQAPRTVIHATGMELNKKERSLKLFKRVKVHYERPDAPPAPPLTIRQVAGKKGAGVKASASEKPKAKAARTKQNAGELKKSTRKARTSSTKTGGPRAANNKTRIRRHYGNSSN